MKIHAYNIPFGPKSLQNLCPKLQLGKLYIKYNTQISKQEDDISKWIERDFWIWIMDNRKIYYISSQSHML